MDDSLWFARCQPGTGQHGREHVYLVALSICSIVVSSSLCTTALSEPMSALAMSENSVSSFSLVIPSASLSSAVLGVRP